MNFSIYCGMMSVEVVLNIGVYEWFYCFDYNNFLKEGDMSHPDCILRAHWLAGVLNENKVVINCNLIE